MRREFDSRPRIATCGGEVRVSLLRVEGHATRRQITDRVSVVRKQKVAIPFFDVDFNFVVVTIQKRCRDSATALQFADLQPLPKPVNVIFYQLFALCFGHTVSWILGNDCTAQYFKKSSKQSTALAGSRSNSPGTSAGAYATRSSKFST